MTFKTFIFDLEMLTCFLIRKNIFELNWELLTLFFHLHKNYYIKKVLFPHVQLLYYCSITL